MNKINAGIRQSSFPYIRNSTLILLSIASVGSFIYGTSVQYRFPRPEFQNEYAPPQSQFPLPRSQIYEYLDVAILIIALSLAAYLALRKRSRSGIMILMIGSLLYFGFYRNGCVCSIGALQNVIQAWFNPGLSIPLSVGLFFVLPLLGALFFGRVFCAAVCPLGGIQDLVIMKPIAMPLWLVTIFRFIPHLYLGVSVLFAATQAGFLICQFDPFVGIFRGHASFGMFIWGIGLLILGIFIARPYCRFLCPYGIILGWMSMMAKWLITITPNHCIQCRLCENSCPFNAIKKPVPKLTTKLKPQIFKKLVNNWTLLPIWLGLSAFAGYQAGDLLALKHHTVYLTEQLLQEEKEKTKKPNILTQTFRDGTVPLTSLTEQTRQIRKSMKLGSTFLGLYLGLVIGLTLIKLSQYKASTDYIPDKQKCLSCGRCFQSCPQEHQRLKELAKEKL